MADGLGHGDIRCFAHLVVDKCFVFSEVILIGDFFQDVFLVENRRASDLPSDINYFNDFLDVTVALNLIGLVHKAVFATMFLPCFLLF